MATHLTVRGYSNAGPHGRRSRAGHHRAVEPAAEPRAVAKRFDPPSPAGQYTADLEVKFGKVLEEVFRDPPAALERFEELAGSMGWGAALAELRHAPETFGPLKGNELFGLIRRAGSRDRAYQVLPLAVQLARVYLASRRALLAPPPFSPAGTLAAPAVDESPSGGGSTLASAA